MEELCSLDCVCLIWVCPAHRVHTNDVSLPKTRAELMTERERGVRNIKKRRRGGETKGEMKERRHWGKSRRCGR